MRGPAKSRAVVASVLAGAALIVAGVVVPVSGLTAHLTPGQRGLPECRGSSVVGDVRVATTKNGSGNMDCVLRYGSRDTQPENGPVRVLQISLWSCYDQTVADEDSGYTDDGDYGQLTAEAVRNVQNWLNEYAQAGLVVDGVYGPQTARYMLHVPVLISEEGDGFDCLPTTS